MSQSQGVIRSISASTRTGSDERPRLSLGNQDTNLANSRIALNAVPPQRRPVNRLPTFFIWSIFNLLFLPLGILCCYFSYKVSRLKMQDRYELAKKWSKRAFVANIMTTLLMIGLIITIVMLHYDYVQRNPDIEFNQTRTTGAYIPWQPGR